LGPALADRPPPPKLPGLAPPPLVSPNARASAGAVPPALFAAVGAVPRRPL